MWSCLKKRNIIIGAEEKKEKKRKVETGNPESLLTRERQGGNRIKDIVGEKKVWERRDRQS